MLVRMDQRQWIFNEINGRGLAYRSATQDGDDILAAMADGELHALVRVAVHFDLATSEELEQRVDEAKGGLE